ncbi:sacsin N-terminal ATP-binding-like domain-containing protein [Mucilaginibacter jinjuensis]|uniref:Histidine kinase/DNA gyrase B/HSP90-like ATPase n=1 Tax=Mucilaginibacter jinjuensis TaxID=1176721 RepID=A0ABY7TBX9_9SPHI|nr:hypothetical protein [Mucilaginibacter jinjuensis]WCT13476.1 hypothetical protein PQO05_05950 [Mucilaginibacter jinjuensis]
MTDTLLQVLDEATSAREQQRSESEARDIIHDVQKIYTVPKEKRTRWIWELLQNARDVAGPEGIDIHIILTPDKLVFKHNGTSFKTKHLLAILYKTSTKSLGGEDGTTGKYGTGFVTTHVLNKKLTVSGVHENPAGERYFTIAIDRTAARLEESQALGAMQQALQDSFLDISAVANSPAVAISDRWHSFTYQLKPETYIYAENGVLHLQRNLAFLLLINPKISSVTIGAPSGERKYKVSDEATEIDHVRFVSVEGDHGLLYTKDDHVIFGVPAVKKVEGFRLLPIEGEAILFKEFPLIGTEGFNLPVFIQHLNFQPTELRDAIRTRLAAKDEPDPIAEKNRTALTDFLNKYLAFMEAIINAEMDGTYLFAKSGLPQFLEIFHDPQWYADEIQTKIRTAILEKPVVVTCAGVPKKIAEAKFILNDVNFHEEFYDLASALIPEFIPIKSSSMHWGKIIEQSTEQWPAGIIFTVEELLKLVPATLDLKNDTSFEWLKKLYTFLDNSGLSYMGETFAIYPNEASDFCTREAVVIHPVIDKEFKKVAAGLGRPLEKEFLDERVGIVTGIKTFDLDGFFKDLNSTMISELVIDTASDNQVKSIFHVCCLFRSDRAFRRDTWFDIAQQLLPDLMPEKKTVSVNYENYWRSAEVWAVKYICALIEMEAKPSAFITKYFDGDFKVGFAWLTKFIDFVFGLGEDVKEPILKRKIIAVQSDAFKPYQESIFRELDARFFTDTIKDIYKENTGHGDPREFLVDSRLRSEDIKEKDVEELAKEIDRIFTDSNIESKVKKDGELNEMFLKLDEWFEQFDRSGTYLRSFAAKRPSLYILALGDGFSKQIMDIRASGKSMDDIAEIAKINLTVDELKLLEAAATEVGAQKLLAKAKELIAASQQIVRWKTIGRAAEKAFTQALDVSDVTFEILNPDIGKDFVILANGREYAIEIKSVDAGKENVNMSILQGSTAVKEKDCYALCVLSRPEDDSPVTTEYFMQHARFVATIGYDIGDSIDKWNSGILSLDSGADVKVIFEEKSESVYVSRRIWRDNISFEDFLIQLNAYFQA